MKLSLAGNVLKRQKKKKKTKNVQRDIRKCSKKVCKKRRDEAPSSIDNTEHFAQKVVGNGT
jgi:hypothetical protein